MSFTSFPIDLILPTQAGTCARAGLSTASDVLLPQDPKKVRKDGLVLDVARAICPTTRTVSELLRDDREVIPGGSMSPLPFTFSTGDNELDALIGGGVRAGAITELVGESGAGKSTLTMSLAVRAGLAGFGTIILTSERRLATSRLVDLAASLCSETELPAILDNIQTNRVDDIDALEHALSFVIPPMLQARGSAATQTGQKPIRLLIVDSITALLRGETAISGAGLTQRSRLVCIITDLLKALAAQFNLAVVVVNQVSDSFPVPTASSQSHDVPMLYSTQAQHFSGQSPGIRKEAALGIVWANAVNTRVMLAKTGRRIAVDQAGEGHEEDKVLLRRAHLVFSPFAAPGTLDFVLEQGGARGLPGSHKALDLGPALRRRDARLRAMGEEASQQSTPKATNPEVDDIEAEADLYFTTEAAGQSPILE